MNSHELDGTRDIIRTSDLYLFQRKHGDYVLEGLGAEAPYVLKKGTRTLAAISMLDRRCISLENRLHVSHLTLDSVQEKLYKIENSTIYRFFHKLGLL